MATIIVNGKSYEGDSIQILVNGVVIKPDGNNINIEVNGDIKDLTIDVCDTCTINGNVGSVKSETGDVTINGNVTGNVKNETGKVVCGDVSGDVKTEMGNVKCWNVSGKVKTEMGSIKYVKKSD